MISPLATLQILAQQSAKRPQGGRWDLMLLMLAPIVIFFIWMTRSQKKRDQKRKDMLAALRKGDKVVTIGGIHGEVSRLNEREVVLMVDKSKGVEMRFLRTAIASGRDADSAGTEVERIGSEGGGN